MRTGGKARKELDGVQPHSLAMGKWPRRARGLSSGFASSVVIGGRGQDADQDPYDTVMYPSLFSLSVADHIVLDPSKSVDTIGKRRSVEPGEY